LKKTEIVKLIVVDGERARELEALGLDVTSASPSELDRRISEISREASLVVVAGGDNGLERRELYPLPIVVEADLFREVIESLKTFISVKS